MRLAVKSTGLLVLLSFEMIGLAKLHHNNNKMQIKPIAHFFQVYLYTTAWHNGRR